MKGHNMFNTGLIVFQQIGGYYKTCFFRVHVKFALLASAKISRKFHSREKKLFSFLNTLQFEVSSYDQ